MTCYQTHRNSSVYSHSSLGRQLANNFIMALEDYKDIVATAAGIAATAQMFMGVFLCKKIYQHGNTKTTPPMQFIGGFIMGSLMLQQGLLIGDPAIYRVNFIGLGLNLFYLTFYHTYALPEDRPDFYKRLARAAAFIAVAVGYANWEDPAVVKSRFGTMLSCFLVYFLSAPLFQIRRIIRTGDTNAIPLPMVLGGCTITSLWSLYGFIINNTFVMLQNGLIFSLCLTQVVLVLFFTKKQGEKKKE